MTIACYINMVKALDTVDYSTLSKKLEAVGFKVREGRRTHDLGQLH